MIEKIWINSQNGRIAGLLQLPELNQHEQCPIAIVLHGIGDHKDTPFMHAIAETLYQANIGTLRIDFHGHGESDKTFTEMTITNEVEDAVSAINFVQQLPQTSHIIVIGHSQGGVVAGLVAGRVGKAISSLILLAPALVLKDGAKEGNILGGEFDVNHLPDTLPIVWGVLGKNYIADAQQLSIYEETTKYEGHVTIIHGTSDSVVPTFYSTELNKRLKDSTLHLLEGYGHSFEPDNLTATRLIASAIKAL